MIFEFFKVSDTDETFLVCNEFLKVDLTKRPRVQYFDTQWDKTIITTKKQPDVEILDMFNYRQLQRSEQPKPSLTLYIQDIVQKGPSRDCARM